MLGVLGGMGPMATVDFLGKVVRNTPAACDQDHVPMVVCQAVTIPDRTAAILGNGADPLPAMRVALARLEAAGATCIAIPCNTAHHWHAALQDATALPILHIAEAVAAELADRPGLPIGLLATTGTVAAGIYGEVLSRHGIACRMPPEAGQAEVMRAIGLVKAGRTAEAGMILSHQAEALIASGCDRVVMACTEIPVALAAVDGTLRLRLLDATEALARACVRAFLDPVAALSLAA